MDNVTSRAYEELAWEKASEGMSEEERAVFKAKMAKMRDLHKHQYMGV